MGEISMAPDPKFKKGAKPSKRYKLLAAKPHVTLTDIPPMVAYTPAQISMWENSTYGCCVTSEEAFNKAAQKPEIFISDEEVKTWATANGYLNGADLTDVMDSMAKSGFSSTGGITGDGPYTAVDYSNEANIQSALSVAPVKIGIDADALPSTAGNQMGWYAYGGTPQQYTSEDHCVSLAGYGTPQQMFSAVGVPTVPADWPAKSTTAYLVFTWNSIGVVDHDWIMSTTGESWLRNPSSTLNGVALPNPGGSTPPPTVFSLTASPTTGTAPLSVSFAVANAPTGGVSVNFGDGTPTVTLGESASSVTHVYAAVGSYTATATGGSPAVSATASVSVSAVPVGPQTFTMTIQSSSLVANVPGGFGSKVAPVGGSAIVVLTPINPSDIEDFGEVPGRSRRSSKQGIALALAALIAELFSDE